MKPDLPAPEKMPAAPCAAGRGPVERLFRLLCPVLLCAAALTSAAAGPLPQGKVPPGKTLMVIQPHHDDHTWQYGFGGLIAKMIDAGYQGIYVRVSNDEKDGGMRHGWGANDIANYEDTLVATRNLGIDEVISLNWAQRSHELDSPHRAARSDRPAHPQAAARRRHVVSPVGQLRPQPRPPQSRLGRRIGRVALGIQQRSIGLREARPGAAPRPLQVLFLSQRLRARLSPEHLLRAHRRRGRPQGQVVPPAPDSRQCRRRQEDARNCSTPGVSGFPNSTG